MDAPIHQVTHDIGSGKTRFDFGPSPMFGVADLLEPFRARLKKKPDAAAVDREAKPEPIQYRANAVNRVMQGGSSGGGAGGDEGTVSVRIFKPLDDPGFDIFFVGSSIGGSNGGRSGNGDQTFQLPAGEDSIVKALSAWLTRALN
jgi:hypothetical protein